MITLHFSHWWLLLALAIVLVCIVAACPRGGGMGGGLLTAFVGLICLAIFLIALAFLVGLHLAQP